MQLILNHATRKYRRLYFFAGCLLSVVAISVYALAWVPTQYGLEDHIAALAITTAANFLLFRGCLQLSSHWKTPIIITTLFTNCFIVTNLVIGSLKYYQ